MLVRTYRAVCRFAGDLVEVSDAFRDSLRARVSIKSVAVDIVRLSKLGRQGALEGRRAVGVVLGSGGRDVVGLEDLGGDDLEVADDVLDRAGDGFGAVGTDGDLPLDVREGVVAPGALDCVLDNGRCLHL